MSEQIVTVIWRRLDRPGHESSRLSRVGDGWRLEGAAVFADNGHACRLDYVVACDSVWQTRSARVAGWVGDRSVHVEIEVDSDRHWSLNGKSSGEVSGCSDVDLNFSPSTNLLPIRRACPAIGDAVTVRAAWLRFPSFRLEALDQVYRRIGEREYRYESGGGSFAATLTVDETGFVTRYPGAWMREDSARAG